MKLELKISSRLIFYYSNTKSIIYYYDGDYKLLKISMNKIIEFKNWQLDDISIDYLYESNFILFLKDNYSEMTREERFNCEKKISTINLETLEIKSFPIQNIYNDSITGIFNNNSFSVGNKAFIIFSGKLQIYDLIKQELIEEIEEISEIMAIHPNENILVLNGKKIETIHRETKSEAYLYNIKEKKIIDTIEYYYEDDFGYHKFTPNGKYLLLNSFDGVVLNDNGKSVFRSSVLQVYDLEKKEMLYDLGGKLENKINPMSNCAKISKIFISKDSKYGITLFSDYKSYIIFEIETGIIFIESIFSDESLFRILYYDSESDSLLLSNKEYIIIETLEEFIKNNKK